MGWGPAATLGPSKGTLWALGLCAVAVTICTSSWLRVVLAPPCMCWGGWVGTELRGTEHPVLHQQLPNILSSVTASPGRARNQTLPHTSGLCLFALWLIINMEKPMSIRAGPDTRVTGRPVTFPVAPRPAGYPVLAPALSVLGSSTVRAWEEGRDHLPLRPVWHPVIHSCATAMPAMGWPSLVAARPCWATEHPKACGQAHKPACN